MRYFIKEAKNFNKNVNQRGRTFSDTPVYNMNPKSSVAGEVIDAGLKSKKNILRGSLIGAGTLAGGALGSAFNSDDSALGTLVGAGVGGGAAAFATGGNAMNTITPKVMNLFKKLKFK